MNSRYTRNRLYITDEEQEIIKRYPIILGGAGIGSVIAECALRLGFENLTIIDGDTVELSNLNRQNYVESDASTLKVEAIKSRLLSINSNANINILQTYLTEENVEQHILGHKIAINALDFSTDVPLIFDRICQKNNISVLHPYNLGWGGIVTIVTPDGLPLDSIEREKEKFNEIKMVEYVSSYMRFWGTPHNWIDEKLREYKNEKELLPPPQLSIGCYLVASMCTHLLFNIATNKEIKKFPEFYMSTIMNE
jgi:molybdopterin/thiamine biosynthesis adenylyltransferase